MPKSTTTQPEAAAAKGKKPFRDKNHTEQLVDISNLLNTLEQNKKPIVAATFDTRLTDEQLAKYEADKKAIKEKKEELKSISKYMTALAALQSAADNYKQQAEALKSDGKKLLNGAPKTDALMNAVKQLPESKSGGTSIVELQRTLLTQMMKEIAKKIAEA